METSLEYILTNSYKDGTLEYMNNHPSEFDELLQLATSDKQPYSWRAAWLLSNCMLDNDRRVKPYVAEIANILDKVRDSQKRDLLKVLCKMDIDEECEGILFDICVDIWCKLDKMPSVRANAFKLILQITKKNPGLYNEVILLADDQYINTLSGGIRNSVRKWIRKLKSELG